MSTWLRQSTAADVEIGPFVDDTDFKTPETALTISQADCLLIKNGGAAAQKNDATSASHLAGGHYKAPLNVTDTNTLGRLRLYVNESGALPVWRDFMVVPAAVFDALVNDTGNGLRANMQTAAAGALASVSAPDISPGSSPTTLVGKIDAIFGRFFRHNELDKDAAELRTYATGGSGETGILSVQAVAETANLQEVGEADWPSP